MSTFRTIGTVARKDLLRKIRSPLATIIMMLFPVVFSLLIGLTFGRSGFPSIKLAYVDQDGGFLSKLIESSFTQGEVPIRFDLTRADSAAAIGMVEADKVSAVLVIPRGFASNVLAQEPTTLEMIKNPAEGIRPQIAEQYVQVLAQLGSGLVKVLGEPLAEISSSAQEAGPPTDAAVTKISVLMNRRMTSVARYAFPPAIYLEPSSQGAEEEEGEEVFEPTAFNIATFMIPGMAAFALLMLALVSMSDVQREDTRKTLARQFVAPIPFSAVILGKVAATWVASLLTIIIITIIAFLLAETSVSVVGFASLSMAFALAATGFAAFIQSLSRSEKTGSAIGSIVVMIMAMLGGSWVPVDQLPSSVKRLAPFTLTYWGGEGYRDLIFETASITDLGPHLSVLLGFGVLFCVVAILRFRHRYGSGV